MHRKITCSFPAEAAHQHVGGLRRGLPKVPPLNPGNVDVRGMGFARSSFGTDGVRDIRNAPRSDGVPEGDLFRRLDAPARRSRAASIASFRTREPALTGQWLRARRTRSPGYLARSSVAVVARFGALDVPLEVRMRAPPRYPRAKSPPEMLRRVARRRARCRPPPTGTVFAARQRRRASRAPAGPRADVASPPPGRSGSAIRWRTTRGFDANKMRVGGSSSVGRELRESGAPLVRGLPHQRSQAMEFARLRRAGRLVPVYGRVLRRRHPQPG